MIKILASIITLLLVAGCAPQAELVKTRSDMGGLREDVKALKARNLELQKKLDQETQQVQNLQKRLDALDTKGGTDAQKAMADYGAKTDQIITDIQLLQGRLEENNFRLAELAQKSDDRAVKVSELAARVDEVDSKIKLLGAGAPAASAAAASPDKEKHSPPKRIEPSEVYRQAKSDYDKGNFDLALAGFQHYMAQFPEASQADSAQYWIGECYYSLKDFNKAIEAFAKVMKNYPKSVKVPGAKLKTGLAYLNEKNPAKAKEYFHKVVKEHPGTNEAEIAKDRLAKIK
ncbi:MAG: tol-pal system protein YbgF [Nitrospirota bacterium]